MRQVMLMHGPLEHRKVCGLANPVDLRFFEALRTALSCGDSTTYADFFGPFLKDPAARLFAVDQDAVTAEDFLAYCEVVGQVDLAGALDADGGLRQGGLGAVLAANRAANEAACRAVEASRGTERE